MVRVIDHKGHHKVPPFFLSHLMLPQAVTHIFSFADVDRPLLSGEDLIKQGVDSVPSQFLAAV